MTEAINSREYDVIIISVNRNILPLGKRLAISAVVSPKATQEMLAEVVFELRAEMDQKEAEYYELQEEP